ncbi:hypothetical protein Bca52824_017967 [Brassica carinata]|uniref:Uncharacterized protein n=1 Tax=Brassica carinata TaxID=52824 RepID=A0A8X8AWX3_BRACI|nr:hypothetical protein Bca52824_017967 [Brassica carinata]
MDLTSFILSGLLSLVDYLIQQLSSSPFCSGSRFEIGIKTAYQLLPGQGQARAIELVAPAASGSPGRRPAGTRRGTSTSGSASSSTETEPAKKIQLVPRRESFCLGLTVRSPGIMAKPVTVVVNPDAALVEVRASEDSSDEEALSGRVGRGARQTRRTVLDSLVELSLHSVAPSDAASNSVGQDMAD